MHNPLPGMSGWKEKIPKGQDSGQRRDYRRVDAGDIDQALGLAKGCPVLDSEGSVEVRPFVSV